jgi:hypothetical protein
MMAVEPLSDVAEDFRGDALAILAGAAEAWEWAQHHLLDAIRACKALEMSNAEIADMLDVNIKTLPGLIVRLGHYARRVS